MALLGERKLAQGMRGEDVIELQIRLAGFRGTLPDGIFGSGTQLQVVNFQQGYMGRTHPSGIADQETITAIEAFGREFPVDFNKLQCPCGECNGFGHGRFKNEYRADKPEVEAYHRYEYPGIHRMLLWSVRALFFFLKEKEYEIIITSGYRCSTHNKQKGRTSTNHHGKAIDLDVPLKPGEDKRDDMRRCDSIRGLLVERANAQIGWAAHNRKSLEPSRIAPTWIHYDVRSYDRKYLTDRFFCTTLEALDGALPVINHQRRSLNRAR